MAGLRTTGREKMIRKEVPATERKRYKRFLRESQAVGAVMRKTVVKLRDGDGGFRLNDVTKYNAALLVRTSRITLKVGYMSDYLEEAKELSEKAMASFDATSKELYRREEALVESSKKASGSIRRSCNDLAGGLKRIEAAANFDRLERLANTLERAAYAVEALAELDREGKLERIAAILK